MDQSSSFDTEEVHRLERELREVIMRQVTIHWQLERMLENSDVLYRNKKIGIHSLPVKILVNVLYELLLAPNSGPIGRLMGVCKQWQQVILNAPLLWSVIHLNIPSSLDKLDSLVAYCQNCVKQSASAPLDICLYFPEIKDRKHSTIKLKQRDKLLQSGGPRLHRWLDRVSHDDPNTIEERMKAHYAQWKRILQILVGDRGEVMGRWNSFECDFFCKQRRHNPILAFLEWNQFDYSTKTLENMVEERHSQISPWQKTPPPPLLPGRYVCRLPNIDGLVNLHGFERPSIRDLVYSWKDPDSLRFILTLHSLTHLHIEFFNTQKVDPRAGQEAIIDLDKEMNIGQGSLRDFWVRLEAPNLETLILTDFMSTLYLPVPIIINYTFPSLKRIVIRQRWFIVFHTFIDFLHELIRHAPCLTSIQCDKKQEFIRYLTDRSYRIVYLSPSDSRPLVKVVEGKGGLPHSIRTLDILTLLED
jgi:hypothetical protein